MQDIVDTLSGTTWSFEKIITIAITFILCIIIIRILTSVLTKALDKTGKLDDRTSKLIVGIIRCALWVVAILILADQIGIPITSLVAFLSVLSLAISLAVQTVLSNVAGGLIVTITKPYKIGDYVAADGVEGEVAEITLINTQLNTPDGLRIVVPNSALSSGKVTNYTVLGWRRVNIEVTASYDTPTEAVRKAGLEAIARTANVLSDPAPCVIVGKYNDSNISYTVRCFCKPGDYWGVVGGVTENLRTTFAENNATMTYNHLNIHIMDKD